MTEVITVYHGGTKEIKSPKVDVGRPNLDFGPGFYVTDLSDQAKAWGRKIGKERNELPILNTYHLRRAEALKQFKCLVFNAYDKNWLEFVAQSRLGNEPWKNYDYIEGGVADDRVVDTVRLYMVGIISSEEALTRLKYFKPTNQICLLSQNLADNLLVFVRSELIVEL